MPSFSVIAVFVLMFSLLGGVSLYLSHRVYQGLHHFVPQISRGWIIMFFAAMTLVMIFGFVRSMLPLSAALRNMLGTVSSYWMGIFVYLLLFMLLADGLCMVLKFFFPISHFLSVAAAVVLALATSVYGVWHANDLQHVTYDIFLSDSAHTKDTRLVLISDLHLGAVGSEKRLESIVQEINAQQPDIVCIAGDFFDNDFGAIRSPEKAMHTLKNLQATHGIYVCPGNHDSGQTVPEMLRFWEACNIRLLADEYVVIDDRLILAGRRDPSPIGGFDGSKRAELETILAGSPEELPVVVMDHNPASASSYGSNVSLVLSGHTHKGQIFPGSLFTGKMYDVDHGYWRKDSLSPHVIVSSGVGTWGMPMRVGTDSEIVTVNLHY